MRATIARTSSLAKRPCLCWASVLMAMWEATTSSTLGFKCGSLAESGHAGACKPGEFLKNVNGDFTECVAPDYMVVDYVRKNCSVFLGWRDNCEDCALDPQKWGRLQGVKCKNGYGDDNLCLTPFINEQWVPLFALNTDGDVNDDDTFYLGMHCEEGPSEAEISSTGPCPAGTLMTGIEADGRPRCANPVPLLQDVVRSSCSLYAGWRDNCDDCQQAPEKWGRVGHRSCSLGSWRGQRLRDHEARR